MNLSHEAMMDFLRAIGVKFFILIMVIFGLTILIPKIFDHFMKKTKNRNQSE